MIKHPLAPNFWEADVEKLLDCLNPWLQTQWQTQLVAAEYEPLYLPANTASEYHQIQFAHGYFNSALHELAHWCVAGTERRLLVDFGYWYEPDGRTAQQQKLFETVEVKPQAIEWHFSLSVGRVFGISVDNLSGEPTDTKLFKEAVAEKAQQYQEEGLPPRAANISNLLQEYFGTELKDEIFIASTL